MYTVIVALDGSVHAERALAYGQLLAGSLGGTLELTHILEEPIAFDLVPSLVLPDRPAAERYLTETASKLASAEAVTTYVIRGNPTEELLRLTNDQPDTILVLSTHGRTGVQRTLLGSVADKVLRGAAAPVLLVRETVTADKGMIKQLVLPLDGSELAAAALPLASAIAVSADATLHLVRVVEPFWHSASVASMTPYLPDEQGADFDAQLQAEASAYLKRVADGLRDRGVRVTWEVRSGRPADEILRTATTTLADLIVVSTHGRSGLRRWVLGSVTDDLVHHSPIPVLAIPLKVGEAARAREAELLAAPS
jgi:nucleotide-binding universal stress UspA family protein